MSGGIHISFGAYLLHEFGEEVSGEILKAVNLERSAKSNEWDKASPHVRLDDGTDVNNVLAAAASVTGKTAQEIAFGFGEYFVVWTCEQGYQKLISSLGRTFVEFVENLSKLNMHLAVSMPDMTPPDFITSKITATSLELHYKSHRPGLGGVFEGIINNVAKTLYNISIEIKLLGGGADGSCDHEVYLITFPSTPSQAINERAEEINSQNSIIGMAPSLFYSTFPFHFVLDEECSVVQFGSGLQKLYPDLKIGVHASEIFKIKLPSATWDYDLLVEYHRSCIVLRSKSGLEFKGQLLPTDLNQQGTEYRRCQAGGGGSGGGGGGGGGMKGRRKPADLGPIRVPNGMGSRGSPSPPSTHMRLSTPSSPLAKRKISGGGPFGHQHRSTDNLDKLPDVATRLSKTASKVGLSTVLGPGQPTPFELLLARIEEEKKMKKSLLQDGGGEEEGGPRASVRVSLLNARSGLQALNGEDSRLSSTASRQGYRYPQLDKTGRRVHSSSDMHCQKMEACPKGLIFLGSPRAMDLDELESHGICLSDIPLHDMSGDFVVLAEQRKFQEAEQKKLQLDNHILEKYTLELELEADTLKEHLVEALGGLAIDTDTISILTPADMILHMMDSIIKGEPVMVKDAIHLRHTIANLAQGHDIHTPLDIMKQMQTINFGDSDVNDALMAMLVDDSSHDQRLNEDDLSELRRRRSVRRNSTLGDTSRRGSQSESRSRRSSNEAIPSLSDECSLVRELVRALQPTITDSSRVNLASPSLVSGAATEANQSQPNSGGSSMPMSSNKEVEAEAKRGLTTGGSYRPSMSMPGSSQRGPDQLQPTPTVPNQLLRSQTAIAKAPKTDNSQRRMSAVTFTSESDPDARGGPSFGVGRYDELTKLVIEPSDKINVVLAKIDEWQFDTFELEKATDGRPLSTLAFAIFKKTNLLTGSIKICPARLARFLCRIEEGYQDHPYHSRTHAADVLRTMHVLLTRGSLQNAIAPPCTQRGHRDITLLSCYMSAIMHDFDHRGYNNDFLVKTSDPLSLLYNDRSPMENHHLAAGFKLLACDQFNFLKHTSPRVREVMRKHIINSVLATDMKQHFTLLSQFNTKFQIRESGENSPGNESGSRVSATVASQMDDDTVALVMQVLMKAADLGHLASGRDAHMQWVLNLEEELFRQGDKERLLGLRVSPLMDRAKAGITKSQPGFFKIVACPLFNSFAAVFPTTLPVTQNLEANLAVWIDEGQALARARLNWANCTSLAISSKSRLDDVSNS